MVVRSSSVTLCFLALAVLFGPTCTQPTFDFGFLCELFCDDIIISCDDCSSTPSNEEENAGSGSGGGNKPSKPAPTQPSMNMSLQFPPSALGMNLTMINSGGSWLMNLMPWIYGSATPAPTASTAAPTTTPAPTTTAAPAGNSTAATTTKKK